MYRLVLVAGLSASDRILSPPIGENLGSAGGRSYEPDELSAGWRTPPRIDQTPLPDSIYSLTFCQAKTLPCAVLSCFSRFMASARVAKVSR